jgi:hypothetical protein
MNSTDAHNASTSMNYILPTTPEAKTKSAAAPAFESTREPLSSETLPGDIPSMEPVRFGSGDMQLDWMGKFVPKPKDPLKAENEHPGGYEGRDQKSQDVRDLSWAEDRT